LIEIEDIDETSLLTEPQKELILYFQYLTLWKGPNNTPVAFNQRWEDPMIIYLMGNFIEAYKTTVENVSDQFNQFMVEGDFDISLTEVEEESNTQVFVGTKAEVAAVWPDMYEIIKDKTYDGYAITPSENAILLSSRIWLSSDYEVLFQHELGHALGLGHSDLCETDQSFMCSNISLDKQIMPMEQDIIKYLYHKDMHSGLSESEIEKVLANILLNE
jgi:predicted Zn-dependent protease